MAKTLDFNGLLQTRSFDLNFNGNGNSEFMVTAVQYGTRNYIC